MDKGLKLLLETYWNGGMWGYKAPMTDEFEQAKAEGYMFASAPAITHDETLCKLRSVLENISPTDIANAFLYSLSSRQLQYRSALGSYYYAIAIPDHSHNTTEICCFCNWMPLRSGKSLELELSSYNIFNFERYKWGGVRHAHPEYALFDLEQFLLLPRVTPTDKDWNILKTILHAINDLPPTKKASAYRELITKKKLIKSNKEEVEVLINILGICGVLSSVDAPCYCDHFVDVWHRAPQEHTNDYAYPLNYWHVSDGINKDRFYAVFGVHYSEL